MTKSFCVLLGSILIISLCSCSTKLSASPRDNYNESKLTEMQRLIDEMPELYALMEDLDAYFVHIYTADMPIWDNQWEATSLLNALHEEIDSSAQISDRASYGSSTMYTVYYGPYASKLEAARIAKKVKDAGYSFYIKVTPSSGQNRTKKRDLSVIDQYRLQIAYKIQNSWESLSDLDDSVAELMALVVIKVMPNGEIKDFLFVKRSGNNYFDELVFKSVMKYNPTDHHPESISEPYVEIGLRFTFEGIR